MPVSRDTTRVLGLTHDDLVVLASHWLAGHMRCPVVFTEMATMGSETPDAIGWGSGGWSMLVECKASRSDFLANDRKNRYVGMGRHRWFLVPQGMVAAEEVPAGWGLLEWDGRKFHETVDAPPRDQYSWRSELMLMMSSLRRMGPHPNGVSVRVYTTETKKRASALLRRDGDDQDNDEEVSGTGSGTAGRGVEPDGTGQGR